MPAQHALDALTVSPTPELRVEKYFGKLINTRSRRRALGEYRKL